VATMESPSSTPLIVRRHHNMVLHVYEDENNMSRDDNGVGRGRVSLSHTHSCKKNSSPSPYPNPTGIKLLSHPHSYRVTGIISYPYPYPCSNYLNINFYKRKKLQQRKHNIIKYLILGR